MKKIEIYTDGACSGNPGPGGWGAILIYGEEKRELEGFEEETTNNRMEMTAAVMALQALKKPCEVCLYSDSSYLVNSFNKGWVYAWENNNWIKSDKKEVKNIDLWQKLLKLDSLHKIKWIKVKGHSDNEYNNLCDKLATESIMKNKTRV